MKKLIVLICTPLTFYSLKDKDAFFEWLDKIKSIKKIHGIKDNLYITISPSKLSYTDTCDFIGIFKRYKFKNYEQLRQLNPDPHWDLLGDSKTKHRSVYPSIIQK